VSYITRCIVIGQPFQQTMNITTTKSWLHNTR